MGLKRLDNIAIIVEDLTAVIAFFEALGMELEGRMPVEGEWVDRVIGLDDVRVEIAMMRLPGGGGARLELSQFHRPAAIRGLAKDAPVNTLGIRRIMFAVDDIHETIARLRPHGGELLDEMTRYEDQYLLGYVRGPEGILVGLAQDLP